MKSSSVIQPNLFNETPIAPVHHFDLAKEASHTWNGKNLDERSAGKFYTPKEIALPLIKQIIDVYNFKKGDTVSIIDPFCGDGRLLLWTVEQLKDVEINLEVHLWDYDEFAVESARKQLSDFSKLCKCNLRIIPKVADSFEVFFNNHESCYDIVITNPPWEVVKPDPEELVGFVNDDSRQCYVDSLKNFSDRLQLDFPLSKPSKMYGGWGVNLARTGTELALRLVKKGGVTGIVSPSSLLADQNSETLRKWIFDNHHISHLNVFPAELRLFKKVDQPSVTFVASPAVDKREMVIEHYSHGSSSAVNVSDISELMKATDNKFPISAAIGEDQLDLLSKFSSFEKLEDLSQIGVWIGRELDETGYKQWTKNTGNYKFIKGRNVQRFVFEDSLIYVDEEIKQKLPASKDNYKIVWRDVSRPTQKRRMIPTLIPPGYIAGNSLGVLTLNSSISDTESLSLLAIMSSLVFEFQVRANLATSHVSSGVVRKMRIPNLDSSSKKMLARLVKERLDGVLENESRIEITVAKQYQFTKKEFETLLTTFPKITDEEREELLDDKKWRNDK